MTNPDIRSETLTRKNEGWASGADTEQYKEALKTLREKLDADNRGDITLTPEETAILRIAVGKAFPVEEDI